MTASLESLTRRLEAQVVMESATVRDVGFVGQDEEALKQFQQAMIVEDDMVSAVHAKVTRWTDGSMTLEDLGSTNGTWLNGHPLEFGHPEKIHPGDTISFGTRAKFNCGPPVARTEPPRFDPHPDHVGGSPWLWDADK